MGSIRDRKADGVVLQNLTQVSTVLTLLSVFTKLRCYGLQAAPTVPVRLGSPLVWTEGVHSLDVDPSPPIPRPTTKIWDQSATKGWQLHIYAKKIDVRAN